MTVNRYCPARRWTMAAMAACAMIALSACGTGGPRSEPGQVLGRPGSGFLDPKPALTDVRTGDPLAPIRLLEPDSVAIVVFLPGSGPEDVADRCEPMAPEPGWRVPEVLRDLAGRRIGSHRLLVYALCTQSVTGAFRPDDRYGTPKMRRRARDLETFVLALEKAGIAQNQIVLAGHSAGAWASLVTVARGVVRPAGVIAFAPSFAGPRAARSSDSGWSWLRTREVTALQEAGPGPALVYAFVGDEFETPEDLAELGALPDVQLVEIAPPTACPGRAHLSHDTPCFAATETARISDFLETVLSGARDGQ